MSDGDWVSIGRGRAIHVDDYRCQVGIAARLREIRCSRGISTAEFAVMVGAKRSETVDTFEKHRRPDMMLETLHKWAALLEHAADYSLQGVLDPAGHETLQSGQMLALARASTDLELLQYYRASRAIVRMAAARRWYGIDLAAIARSTGTTSTAVKNFESIRCDGLPMLSSMQRYARALGGTLHVTITPDRRTDT